MKESNVFNTDSVEVNLGTIEDKSLEEIICIIDACYGIQESENYGFDTISGSYKLKAFYLVEEYLRAKSVGEITINTAQLLSHSVNDFSLLFENIALSKMYGTKLTDYTHNLMKKEEFKNYVLKYRQEKVAPIVLDIIETLKLEKIK